MTILRHGGQLLPREDRDVAGFLEKLLRDEGVSVVKNAEAKSVVRKSEGIELQVSSRNGQDASTESTIAASVLLISAGRRPNIQGLGLETIGVAADGRGVKTNEYLQTSQQHIYAAGDIGATLAFLIARYLLCKNIEEFAYKNPRFKAIDDAVGKNGWKIIGLLRLSPLIPFNLSNYFYGITSFSFAAYVAVSAVGMIPGTLFYAYLGAIGKAGISGEKTQHSAAQYILLALGLIATIAVTVLVSRIAKSALKKSGAAN